MNWYIEVLTKKYATFAGRAPRPEYWYFLLFNIIASIILGFIDRATGTFNAQMQVGLLSGIYGLAVLIPGLAVTVRRLHDIGRTGWWFFIVLIPILGVIVLLVFMVTASNAGENQYGPPPRSVPGNLPGEQTPAGGSSPEDV
jgi:uncharacterized membrane protein YhaH (DUF805 family)